MSNWVTISADDLKDYLVAAQLNALRTASLAAGQADPFLKVMPDVVAMIRNAVQSGYKTVSATPNTVPPELRGDACLLIIEKLSLRLSIAIHLNEDQKGAIQRAYDKLKRIEERKTVVTMPDDPESAAKVQSGAVIKLVTSKTRAASRDQTGGML